MSKSSSPPLDDQFRSISPLVDHQEYCEATLLRFYADKIFNITFEADKRCYKFKLADQEYYFREESRSFTQVDPSSLDIENQPTITAYQFYEDLAEALDRADQKNNLRSAVVANDFSRVKELLEAEVSAFFESKEDVAAGTKFTDDPDIMHLLHFYKIIWITPLTNRQDIKKIDTEKFAEILLRHDHPQCISAIQKLQTYTIYDTEPNIIDSNRMAEIWMNEYSYSSPDVDSAARARIILSGEERSALEAIFADDTFCDSEKLEKYKLAPGFEWNIAKITSGIRNISDVVNREEFSKIVAKAALRDDSLDAARGDEPSGSFKAIASVSKFNTKGFSLC